MESKSFATTLRAGATARRQIGLMRMSRAPATTRATLALLLFIALHRESSLCLIVIRLDLAGGRAAPSHACEVILHEKPRMRNPSGTKAGRRPSTARRPGARSCIGAAYLIDYRRQISKECDFMTKNGIRVVVIGGGIGGAGCAALLAEKGFEVTLIERNGFAGGKGASFEKDGFVYDTGVHAIGNGDKGPLGLIDRTVGGNLKFNLITGGNRIAIGGNVAHYPLEYASEDSVAAIIKGIGARPENFDGCFTCFKELLRMRAASEMEILDETPLKEYVDRFTDDPNFHQMINSMCGMLIVVTYFTGSTGEFIYCFARMAENASLSYPVGGLGAIAKSYISAFERMGGKVEFNSAVEGVTIEKGRVAGVETSGGPVPADIVVSNMGLQPTVRMVRDHLDRGYVDRAMSLKSSYGAVSVKYALDAEVVEYPLTLWIPDVSDPVMAEKYVGVFYPVPSIPDPGLVPEGCQLVLAGALVPPHPKHKELNEQILNRIEATMSMLHPSIDDHIVWKLRTGTEYIAGISGRELGEVIGLAQDYRQVGKNRPDPRMPIGGLYLVGADAGGRGIGTEMAADSALNVSEMIAEDAAK
jgi:prolycopene isomerase